MRLRFTFLFLIVTLNLFSANRVPVAVKGIIDLRQIENPEKFIVMLNGEWEFYWHKMLHPHDFSDGSVKPEFYGKVPSYWTDYPEEKVKTKKEGYATYRLTVLLPKDFRNASRI